MSPNCSCGREKTRPSNATQSQHLHHVFLPKYLLYRLAVARARYVLEISAMHHSVLVFTWSRVSLRTGYLREKDGELRRSTCCITFLLILCTQCSCGSEQEAVVDILTVVSFSHLDDTLWAAWRLIMFCWGFFYVDVRGHRITPVDGTVSIHKTPERLCTLENATNP